MKISDQALLALVRMNRSKDHETYFNQKIFCDLDHITIELARKKEIKLDQFIFELNEKKITLK